MLNFLTKLMKNTKEKKEDGLLASEMDLAQLKELAVSLKLFSVEEVSKMKKPAILKAVHAWEKVEIAKKKKNGMRVLGGLKPTVAQEQPTEDTYMGKKVKSRTRREINGKMYEDIKVVSGEIFTNPITE